MNDKYDNQTDIPFEQDSDRPAELDELNFEDDEPTPSFVDLSPENELTGNDFQDDEIADPAMPGDDPTDDDLAPETLIHEDGGRSAHEPGEGKPTDKQFTIVDVEEIGVGYGLDEAELARAKPLDGKPWDGPKD